jgi:hypothetical protein
MEPRPIVFKEWRDTRVQVCPYKLISKLKIVTTMFHVNRYRMLEVRRAMRRKRIFRDTTNPLEKYMMIWN